MVLPVFNRRLLPPQALNRIFRRIDFQLRHSFAHLEQIVLMHRAQVGKLFAVALLKGTQKLRAEALHCTRVLLGFLDQVREPVWRHIARNGVQYIVQR